jgi:hypothetical protein
MFSGNFGEGFVVAQRDELRMPQDSARRPFSEFDFSHGLKLQPNVIPHFLGSDALAPVAGLGGRQICELALCDPQWLERLKQGSSVRRVQSLMHLPCEHRLSTFEISDQQYLQPGAVQSIGADDKILTWFQRQFEPKFTRAASSTASRAKSNFLSVNLKTT